MQNGIPDRPLDPEAVRSASANLLPPRDERRMKEMLEALCDATRVKIVQALSAQTPLAAGDLAHVIGRSRSATSQHLKVLRELDIVSATRQGNVVRYELSKELPGNVIENAVAAFGALRNGAA